MAEKGVHWATYHTVGRLIATYLARNRFLFLLSTEMLIFFIIERIALDDLCLIEKNINCMCDFVHWKVNGLVLIIYINSKLRLFKHIVRLKYYFKSVHILRLKYSKQVYANWNSIFQFGLGRNSQTWLVISKLISLKTGVLIHLGVFEWFAKLFSSFSFETTDYWNIAYIWLPAHLLFWQQVHQQILGFWNNMSPQGWENLPDCTGSQNKRKS